MRKVGILLLLCAGAATGITPDERTLARQGIEPTSKSLRRYLRALKPDEATTERIERLIRRLGSGDPAARDHAMRELMRLGSAPAAALERAVHAEEPEVRRWAIVLLESAEGRRTAEVLYSVFRVIRAREILGMTAEILNVIPLADDTHVRRAAIAALIATARAEDLPMLLESATRGEPETRMACFSAIRKLSGDKAKPVLREALRSSAARVRFAAAFELANLGDRTALPVLVELLDAEDEWIRYRAANTLRSIAGRTLGYSAGRTRDKRAPATRKWRDWLAGEGARIQWQTPLKWFAIERERTLVAVYSGGKVIELDDDGKEVWSVKGLRNPWAVRGLPDGHRLISLYSDKVVYEYDERGERIWESNRLPGNISGVDRLPNGNILVALGTTNGQLMEISREKKIVWKLTLKGRPVSARVLRNGNILVALHDGGAVVEVDREGRVQWRVKNLKQPYSAERLPNGNVLVASYGGQRIAEFDRDGALVWEKRSLPGLYTAKRLPDGSTLYADKASVVRCNANGDITWRKPIPGNYLYIDRY